MPQILVVGALRRSKVKLANNLKAGVGVDALRLVGVLTFALAQVSYCGVLN